MPIQPIPTPSSAADPEELGSAGPLLAVVAKGLELWLKQQCQSVQTLDLRLEGSMAQLLRGRLLGVRLEARQVVFQDLCLEKVDLHSDPIQLRIGGLLRGQSLQLNHPFLVRGSVVLTGEGLNRSLATEAWQPLSNQLGQELLGVAPLESVGLVDEHLILRAPAAEGGELVELETRMVLTPSGLAVHPLDGRPPLPLAMDEAIRLDRAEVRSGLLELAGEALVQP
jgi:hypothetical protein